MIYCPAIFNITCFFCVCVHGVWSDPQQETSSDMISTIRFERFSLDRFLITGFSQFYLSKLGEQLVTDCWEIGLRVRTHFTSANYQGINYYSSFNLKMVLPDFREGKSQVSLNHNLERLFICVLKPRWWKEHGKESISPMLVPAIPPHITMCTCTALLNRFFIMCCFN